jgi:hypothetical protein
MPEVMLLSLFLITLVFFSTFINFLHLSEIQYGQYFVLPIFASGFSIFDIANNNKVMQNKFLENSIYSKFNYFPLNFLKIFNRYIDINKDIWSDKSGLFFLNVSLIVSFYPINLLKCIHLLFFQFLNISVKNG